MLAHPDCAVLMCTMKNTVRTLRTFFFFPPTRDSSISTPWELNKFNLQKGEVEMASPCAFSYDLLIISLVLCLSYKRRVYAVCCMCMHVRLSRDFLCQ